MSHGPLRAFSIIKFIGEGHNTSAENFHRREKEWLTVRVADSESEVHSMCSMFGVPHTNQANVRL